jgi:hypothetical protein
MPVTSIKIGDNKLMFITQQFDKMLSINLYICDDDYVPVGKPHVSELEIDEETYHRNLRKESIERDQFMQGFSTNPEWTPGYIEEP